MAGDAAAFLISQPGDPAGRPDFSRADPRPTLRAPTREQLAQYGIQTGAGRYPQFDNLLKLAGGEDPIARMNAEAAVVNAAANRVNAEANRSRAGRSTSDLTAKPTITITTKEGDNTITRKVTKEEFDLLPKTVQRDAVLEGQIAKLEAMLARGVKKADLTPTDAHEAGFFGGEPISDLLAQLRAKRGGAAPAASAPAAAGKVVVEKDGKKFRLPKAQLDQAQREGYKLVPQAP